MPPLPLIADVCFSTEAIGVITALLTALTGAVLALFRLLHNSTTSDRDSWRQMYFKAMEFTDILASENRKMKGEPPLAIMPPVIPEQSSPPTIEQVRRADVATERARVTAVERKLHEWVDHKGEDAGV